MNFYWFGIWLRKMVMGVLKNKKIAHIKVEYISPPLLKQKKASKEKSRKVISSIFEKTVQANKNCLIKKTFVLLQKKTEILLSSRC